MSNIQSVHVCQRKSEGLHSVGWSKAESMCCVLLLLHAEFVIFGFKSTHEILEYLVFSIYVILINVLCF